jgi:hypothetical protein
MNPGLEDALFGELLEAGGQVTRTLLLHQPITPERWRRIREHFGEGEIPEILGENPGLCMEAAEGVIERGSPGLLRRMAANEHLPGALLERLAERRELRPVLAANPALPAETLRHLYADEELREALAANPATPPELLGELFETGEFRYHQALAANPSTPMEILHQLKTDHRLWLILQKNETFVREANREMGMR